MHTESLPSALPFHNRDIHCIADPSSNPVSGLNTRSIFHDLFIAKYLHHPA